jgi:hypothetical protein
VLDLGIERRNGRRNPRRYGRVTVSGHEMFTIHDDDLWWLVINGKTVDRFTNKFAALDVIGRLAEALAGRHGMSEELVECPSNCE